MALDFSDKARIRLVLTDDHEITRMGVRRLLSVDPYIEIVAEADCGEECLVVVEREKPDVVLMDILMPRMNGIEATKQLKEKYRNIIVIMLTSFDDQKHLEQALHVGADGYLSKEIRSKELAHAVRTATHGERVFSPSIFQMLHSKRPVMEKKAPEMTVSFTRREEEILDLVAQGLTSGEIGEQLFISSRTVETHRARLMEKLNCKNAAGLIRFAIMHSTYFSVASAVDHEI